MKPFAYIILFLFGLIAFQWVFAKCERNKIMNKLTAYQSALDSCLYAKPKIDTVWQFSTLKDTIKLKFRYDVIRIDTVNDTIETREYKGHYTSDLLAVRWRAVVFGELKSLEILPTSSYRFPSITQTRVVAIPARDCKPGSTFMRSHLWVNMSLYGGGRYLMGSNLEYLRKEGWGLSVGFVTDFDDIYWGGGLKFRIK